APLRQGGTARRGTGGEPRAVGLRQVLRLPLGPARQLQERPGPELALRKPIARDRRKTRRAAAFLDMLSARSHDPKRKSLPPRPGAPRASSLCQSRPPPARRRSPAPPRAASRRRAIFSVGHVAPPTYR